MRDYKEQNKMDLLRWEFERYLIRMNELLEKNEIEEDEILGFTEWSDKFLEREVGFEV